MRLKDEPRTENETLEVMPSTLSDQSTKI